MRPIVPRSECMWGVMGLSMICERVIRYFPLSPIIVPAGDLSSASNDFVTLHRGEGKQTFT